MSEILDINAIIDALIADFPGDRQLQKELGLPIQEQPIEFLSDIPWPDPMGSIRRTQLIIRTLPIARESIAKREELCELEQKYLTLTDRIMMMQLILMTNCCPSVVDDWELLRLYIEIALPRYHAEEQELVKQMNDFFKNEFSERIRLQKILGE